MKSLDRKKRLLLASDLYKVIRFDGRQCNTSCLRIESACTNACYNILSEGQIRDLTAEYSDDLPSARARTKEVNFAIVEKVLSRK